MEIKLTVETFAHFASASAAVDIPHVLNALKTPPPLRLQNYRKAFNTLGVTTPVRVPPSLSNRNLPIRAHKDTFLRAIEQHQVVIVAAEPSTETSTQLPQFILEEAGDRDSKCRIICAQTKQLATLYSSARVAKDRSEYFGSVVGNQIKLNFNCGLTSGLIYCTYEILLNTLVNDGKNYLRNITHIIVDDVQEYDPSSYVLLVLLREYLKTNKKLKVILISAGNDVALFTTYFENLRGFLIKPSWGEVNRLYLEDVLGMFYDAERLDSDALFEKIMYDCSTLKDNKNFLMLLHLIYANNAYANRRSRDGLTALDLARLFERNQLVPLLMRLGAKFDSNNSEVHIDVPLITKLLTYAHAQNKGATLVYLPSYEDLIATKESLLLSLPIDVGEYELVIMYESMDPNSCQRALEVSENKHKIILSTGATENGVIIPNVAHVIDVGLTENNSIGMPNASWISQDVAIRRANKAANNGTCFHLYTKSFYETLRKRKPLRSSLHGSCLRIKLLSSPTDDPIEFFKLAPKPPNRETVKKAIRDLTILGALKRNGKLTELGTFLAQLSVEPRFGKMLVYSVIFKCLDPILTIVACLCYKNPIVLPQDTALNDITPLSEYAGDFLSDHLVLIKIYQAWQNRKVAKRDVNDEAQCVNWYAMEMVQEIRGDLLSQMRGIGLINWHQLGKTRILNENSDRWPVVKAILASGCYTNICFVRQGQEIVFDKSSALGVSTLPNNQDFCVVYEDCAETNPSSRIRFGTIVTPLTVALMYEHVKFKSVGETKLKSFSMALRDLVFKKISYPDYEFNEHERELFNATRDALCNEENRLNWPQPQGVGVMPRLCLNLHAKSTRHQLNDLYDKHGYNVDRTFPNVTYERRTLFFVVKPKNYDHFYRSVNTGRWTFRPKSEKKLQAQLNRRNVVKLFFSVSHSDHFQGVAELVTKCHLAWISFKKVSYESIRMSKLKNVYDDNKYVCDGKDGQEVEYEAGLQLLNMFH
ncbi:hypothetical protein FQR65_LT14520 [Abscondita terminalis]|nr:hypothetical protein FQR65_LT14520 [Abscondita terminalis]